MQPGEKTNSEAKESKALIIIIKLLHDITFDCWELSSVFLLRVILTELTSAEFSVNYKDCLGDSYNPSMCFMLV